jgi:hypothetical protein
MSRCSRLSLPHCDVRRRGSRLALSPDSPLVGSLKRKCPFKRWRARWDHGYQKPPRCSDVVVQRPERLDAVEAVRGELPLQGRRLAGAAELHREALKGQQGANLLSARRPIARRLRPFAANFAPPIRRTPLGASRLSSRLSDTPLPTSRQRSTKPAAPYLEWNRFGA